MKIIRLFVFSLLVFSLSCKDDTPVETSQEVPITTVYLIRHAEKDRTDPENKDPELNQKGLGRAMHWAEILNDVPVDAIYTTDYLRTSMTAEPLSVKQDVNKIYYDPSNVNITQFKSDNLGKNVVVVGHSNTTPQFVNQLLGEEKYAAMDDSDNGSLFIVRIYGDQADASRLHFNCNCPD